MRDFHATPDLCPPPAACADIARRRLLTAVAAAPVIAAAFPASAERRSDDGDAPLFEMSRRIAELEAEIEQLCDEAAARHRALPRIKWSPEELAQHRIVGAHDTPRFVSEDDINDSDRHDAPPRAEWEIAEKDDGITLIQTYTTTRRTPSEAETTA